MIKSIERNYAGSGDEEILVKLNDLVDIRESPEFKEASDAFERYMEDYARKTHMTQKVLSEMCGLAADATNEAMKFCFLKGFEMGAAIAKDCLEEEMRGVQELPESTPPVS